MILLKSLDTAKHLITFVKNNAIVNALKVRNNAGCDLVDTVDHKNLYIADFPKMKLLGPIYLQNTLLKPRFKNSLSILVEVSF